jgi:hypothetical protein
VQGEGNDLSAANALIASASDGSFGPHPMVRVQAKRRPARPGALTDAPEPSLTELPPLLVCGTIWRTDVNAVGGAAFKSQDQCASEARSEVVAELLGFPRCSVQLGAGLDRPFFCGHDRQPLPNFSLMLHHINRQPAV